MSTERQLQIEILFEAARNRPARERAAFLAQACDDDELRREVESLLAYDPRAEAFMEVPAIDLVAQARAQSQVGELPAGSMLGGFQILGLIGKGGMGQVYRARDSKLKRDVAIKVLPDDFALDADRRARFQREAEVLASLNHPHIASIYDLGESPESRFLVLELVEGQTLAAQIRRGRLPMDGVMRYGAQIADALAEAHNAGIVHRDLKPGNVMITRHGVKVLDFGLAKLEGHDRSMTGPSVVMGTPAYMAPEQIAGKAVGPQTDLFALGLVLYEMATGQRPLPEASLGHALLGGLTAVTTVSKIRADATALDGLIARLLTADPSQRPASAAAVADELRALAAPKSRRNRVAVLASVAAVVVIGVTALWLATRSNEPQRLEVSGIQSITNLTGDKLDPAYSPDGAAIAFSWRGPDGKSPGIYVLDRDAREPRRISDAKSSIDDVAPAWSPDGTQIAFERLSQSDAHELMVVAATGGPERRLREVRQSPLLSNPSRPLLTWTPDGNAIVIPTLDHDVGRASLFRIGVHGEPPQRLFESTGGDGDGYPAFSPDGRWFAYASVERYNTHLFVRRMGRDGLPEGPPQEVPAGAGSITARLRTPGWSPDSRRVLFAVGGKVMEWEIGGVSRELWVSEANFQNLTAHWTDGVLSQLVYAALVDRFELRELQLDAEGRHAQGPPVQFLQLGSIACPQFSPDGRWFMFCTSTSLWIATPKGETPRQLANLLVGAGAHFSPDSRHIAFHSVMEQPAPLYVVDLDGTGAATAVRKVAQTNSIGLVGASWSANGEYLYTTAMKTPPRVMRARVSDGELDDLFDGRTPVVASDGRRIFYKKTPGSGLFARSLEDNRPTNIDEEVVSGCVMPWGIVPTSRGVYYIACDERQDPVKLRYLEFSSRRSFDVGPPPRDPQPIMTVSADGRRLIYQTRPPNNGELMRVSFRRAER